MVTGDGGLPRGADGIVRIRVLRPVPGAELSAVPRTSETDARLVARMITLIDEAMEIARLRCGSEGIARIDTLAVEIFRVMRADEGTGEPEAAPHV